jgi:PadR family transcriptional regulator, regulatory protein PadR
MNYQGNNRSPREEAKAVEAEVATRLPRATRTTVKILESFLERPTEERHGFRLFDEAKIQSGTGYPILLRLEKIGWLSSRWEESDEPGPRRRLYRLTAEGEPAVRRFLAEKRAGRFRLGGIPKPSPGEVGP